MKPRHLSLRSRQLAFLRGQGVIKKAPDQSASAAAEAKRARKAAKLAEDAARTALGRHPVAQRAAQPKGTP